MASQQQYFFGQSNLLALFLPVMRLPVIGGPKHQQSLRHIGEYMAGQCCHYLKHSGNGPAGKLDRFPFSKIARCLYVFSLTWDMPGVIFY